jgi:dihydrofolate reductase
MSPATRVTPPRLEIVVAAARNGVIGRGNALPWHLPADLAHFKRITLGHPVLMGRRTFESIGRALPGRHNIVLSRDPSFRPAGASVVRSLEEAWAAAAGEASLMVIGGADLFRACLPSAAVLHLTEVDAEIAGDVHFPPWARDEWQEVAREAHPADARHRYPYSFVTLTRRAP